MDDHLLAPECAVPQIVTPIPRSTMVETLAAPDLAPALLDDAPAAPDEVPAPYVTDERGAADVPRLAPVADDGLPTGVELGQVLEALLFASDAPLSAHRLAELAGAGTPTTIRAALTVLNDKYAAAGLAFRVEEIAGGYQLLTLSAYRPWLTKLHQHQARTRLSNAALETLAIVAYKQPVIRADVDAIRGVSCGESLNRLRELGLVRVVGRAEIVGRPMLYGTTRKFLDLFGLADLNELPPLEALQLRRSAEAELSERTTTEPVPVAASA